MRPRTEFRIIAFAVGSVLFSWLIFSFAWSTYGTARKGYEIAATWRPLAGPYSAKVVGSPIWGNGDRTRIATVRITFADGKTADFNSSRRGSYSTGDTVRVLTDRVVSEIKDRGTVIYRRTDNVYDIDDPFMLWISDALFAGFLVLLALAAPIFGFKPYYSAWKAQRPGAVPPKILPPTEPCLEPQSIQGLGGPIQITPGNVAIGVVFGVISNWLAVHCYMTGEMIGGTRHHPSVTIVDARISDPVIFWIYLSLIASGALALDVILLKLLVDWLRSSFGERPR